MRIAILSTFDVIGGAFKAAYRIHRGLIEKGVDSKMFVANKSIDDYTVLCELKKVRRRIQIILPFINKIPLLFYRNRKEELFSPAWITSSSLGKMNEGNFHIAHLQWINNGFISIRALKNIKQPIIFRRM